MASSSATDLLISTACAGVLLFLLGFFKLGTLVRYVPVSLRAQLFQQLFASHHGAAGGNQVVNQQHPLAPA